MYTLSTDQAVVREEDRRIQTDTHRYPVADRRLHGSSRVDIGERTPWTKQETQHAD
jgi:hypothetical protein